MTPVRFLIAVGMATLIFRAARYVLFLWQQYQIVVEASKTGRPVYVLGKGEAVIPRNRLPKWF